MQLFPLVCNNLSTPPLFPLSRYPLGTLYIRAAFLLINNNSQGLERYQKTLKRTVMASTAPNVHCPESTCFTRENLLLRLQGISPSTRGVRVVRVFTRGVRVLVPEAFLVLQEKVQRQLDQSGAAQDLRSIVLLQLFACNTVFFLSIPSKDRAHVAHPFQPDMYPCTIQRVTICAPCFPHLVSLINSCRWSNLRTAPTKYTRVGLNYKGVCTA